MSFLRTVVPGLASFIAMLLLLATPIVFLALYFTLGPKPCQDQSQFFGVTQLAIPVTMLCSSIWLLWQRNQASLMGIVGALLVPAGAFASHAIAARTDAAGQVACAKRSLQEAIAFCRADPSHYQISRMPAGYHRVLLVAPGTTDKSWSCLMDWAQHASSASMEVDESVYEHYRRTHGRP